MALIPILTRDSTIKGAYTELIDSTVYSETEPKEDFAAYLFVTQKKLSCDSPITPTPISPLGASLWNVPLTADSHYQAVLVLIPTFAHLDAAYNGSTISSKVVFYHEGKVYRYLVDTEIHTGQSPSVIPSIFVEIEPTLDNFKESIDKTYISAPFDFLWYRDYSLKYTHFVRQMAKECTSCDSEYVDKAMKLYATLLKINTAESLSDWRGGQLIIESEEDLSTACTC